MIVGGSVMKCPCCNEEMNQGYLQCKGELFWTSKPKKIFITANTDDDILLEGASVLGSLTKANHCPNCKRIIIDL